MVPSASVDRPERRVLAGHGTPVLTVAAPHTHEEIVKRSRFVATALRLDDRPAIDCRVGALPLQLDLYFGQGQGVTEGD